MSRKPTYFGFEIFTIGMSSHWVQNWKYYYIYVLDSCSLCVIPASVFTVFNLIKIVNVAELLWTKRNSRLIVMIATDNKVFWIELLEMLEQRKADAAQVRARAKWVEKGEKLRTPFFFPF